MTLSLELVKQNNLLAQELLKRVESCFGTSEFLSNTSDIPSTLSPEEQEEEDRSLEDVRQNNERLYERLLEMQRAVQRRIIRTEKKLPSDPKNEETDDIRRRIKFLRAKLLDYESEIELRTRNANNFDLRQITDTSLIKTQTKIDLEKSIEDYSNAIASKQKKIHELQQLQQSNRQTYDELNVLLKAISDRCKKYEDVDEMDIQSEEIQKEYIHKLKQRARLLRDNNKELTKEMQNFLTKYFPSFNIKAMRSQKRERIESYFSLDTAPGIKYKTLMEIIQLLLKQITENPENPHVPIDVTFWPPYVELLLHAHIIEKDSRYGWLIKLVSFHNTGVEKIGLI